jgi:hypothetical protein
MSYDWKISQKSIKLCDERLLVNDLTNLKKICATAVTNDRAVDYSSQNMDGNRILSETALWMI